MMVSNAPLNVPLWWRLGVAGHSVGSRASAEVLGMSVVWDGSLDMLQLSLWWSGRLTCPPHGSCICSLSPYCDRTPGRSNLKKKGLILAHSLRVQSIMVGNSQRHDFDAAGHIPSTVRKQRAMTSQLACPLLFRTSVIEWCCPQGIGLLTSVNLK